MTATKRKRRAEARRLRLARAQGMAASAVAAASPPPSADSPSPSGESPPSAPASVPEEPGPPEPESRRLARRHTDQAFRALASVMRDRKAAATARVTAANTLLEWGHGKRGITANIPEVIEKVVDIQWADE
jgi:hypothetical protein